MGCFPTTKGQITTGHQKLTFPQRSQGKGAGAEAREGWARGDVSLDLPWIHRRALGFWLALGLTTELLLLSTSLFRTEVLPYIYICWFSQSQMLHTWSMASSILSKQMRKSLSPLHYSYRASHCLQQRPSYKQFWFRKADTPGIWTFKKSPRWCWHGIRSARAPWVSLISFVFQTRAGRWNSLQNSDPLFTTNCWMWFPQLLNQMDVSMLSDAPQYQIHLPEPASSPMEYSNLGRILGLHH